MQTTRSNTSKQFSKAAHAAAMGALLVTAGLSTAASASPMRPSWIDSTGANEAYLSDVGHRFQAKTELDTIFSADDAGRLHQRFEQMNNKYERMRNYGTFSPTYQAAELEEMSKYRDDVEGTVTSYQQNLYLERVKNAALEDENIGHFRGPLGVLFGIAAVYNGVPVQWKASEGTLLSASTQKGKSAQFQAATPMVTGIFEFSSEAATASTPYEPTPADPLRHAERYKFGMSRSLNFWELSTTVSYGSTTDSMTSALSKPVTKNLTASVEQVHPLGSGDSYVSSDEGRVRMDYQLNF